MAGRVRITLLACLAVIMLGGGGCSVLRPQPKVVRVDYSPLRTELEAFVSALPASYGIFFKDLTSGQTSGINEGQLFKAASLNKVPTVLYLNNLIAQGKLSPRDRVTFNRETDLNPQGGIMQIEAVDGASYSLRVLANLSITLSDNTAHEMLLRFLGVDNIARFMKEIGGLDPYPGGENLMTARDMGTYLEAALDFARKNPELGNRLIDDLSNTIWDFGLTGMLPPAVQVAHKEGARVAVQNDAGIVYTRSPYILVIMSDGNTDENEGFRLIAEISRRVYDFQERATADRMVPGPGRGSE